MAAKVGAEWHKCKQSCVIVVIFRYARNHNFSWSLKKTYWSIQISALNYWALV